MKLFRDAEHGREMAHWMESQGLDWTELNWTGLILLDG